MINAIPLLGWLLSVVVSISMSIPFWLIWTVGGIGQTYFYWLPVIYQAPGFWACVGLFIVISILKAVLVPKFVHLSSESNSK
jgi:hypothetical protein